MEKREFETIIKIVERAETMDLLISDRITLIMDLEYATKEFNLRLSDFLNGKRVDFVHDICGIQKNFNRQTKKMENFFVPRFSGGEINVK